MIGERDNIVLGRTKNDLRARGGSRGTLVTGGTGFLGGLVAAVLLIEEGRPLLLPIRDAARAPDCVARIRLALLDLGADEAEAEGLLSLLHVVALAEAGPMHELDGVVGAMNVDEIVHCAGCTDYFDKHRLWSGNVTLTEDLLGLARRWEMRRFVYISTAYCSGYRSGTIAERLHPEPAPGDEPTEYTRSKRIAEWRVAESGVPFVIIRPSIVIGHGRTGVYRGRNYGLYQIWRAWEALLGPDYSSIWYTVSPPMPLNLLHHDAFQAGFLAIYRELPPGVIVHLVADHAKCPTMRDLCWLWAEVYCPTEIRSYGLVDDVPLWSLPTRQRRFLELSAKNLEIATHPWLFEMGHLDSLRANGLELVDASVETVARCQRAYVARSPRIREHMRRYAWRADRPPRFVTPGRGDAGTSLDTSCQAPNRNAAADA